MRKGKFLDEALVATELQNVITLLFICNFKEPLPRLHVRQSLSFLTVLEAKGPWRYLRTILLTSSLPESLDLQY